MSNKSHKLYRGISHTPTKRAFFATCIFFVCYGALFMTYLSRLVGIREKLGTPDLVLDSTHTSFLLLASSLGSFFGAPFFGKLLTKVSVKKTIVAAPILVSIGLFALANVVSFSAGSLSSGAVPYGFNDWRFDVCLLILVYLGTCFSLFNVSINISGVNTESTAVEIGGQDDAVFLPRFHSFFQFGAVLATLFSTFIAFFNIDMRLQFALVIIIALVVVYKFRGDILESPASSKPAKVKTSSKAAIQKNKPSLRATFDKPLVCIALIVLASTFCEGSGSDWIGSAFYDGFGSSEAISITGLWIYLLTTASTRYNGHRIIGRLGQYLTLRISFGLVLVGILIFVFAPNQYIAVLACIPWGFGVALSYPIGMSEAGKSGDNPSMRTSIVASGGSVMGIAGPPTIGLLGNIISIRLALLILVPFSIVGFVVSHILKKTK
ncbi:MAG: hypothetical protein LBN03_01170 [Bifidobacteriaceae bacterium]|jgi:MFS family permease|nr:hypothetical protein [Bifidobacteriaceae bacterium]